MDIKEDFGDAMRILCENPILPYQQARIMAGRLCTNVLGLNVLAADDTWCTCKYKYRVFIHRDDVPICGQEFADFVALLRDWFGGAEFFWGSGNSIMFLCAKK
ncbi:MAG: hypothetical protein PUC18_12505 [Prevotellaceae bacterium]|nr:hypothetical protein [Prevotellaceae bacterium]